MIFLFYSVLEHSAIAGHEEIVYRMYVYKGRVLGELWLFSELDKYVPVMFGLC